MVGRDGFADDGQGFMVLSSDALSIRHFSVGAIRKAELGRTDTHRGRTPGSFEFEPENARDLGACAFPLRRRGHGQINDIAGMQRLDALFDPGLTESRTARNRTPRPCEKEMAGQNRAGLDFQKIRLELALKVQRGQAKGFHRPLGLAGQRQGWRSSGPNTARFFRPFPSLNRN